jgi:flagellar hook assembly protein FlgD
VPGLPTAGTGAIGVSPNPFNPETQIRFTTARAGHVTARVYDVTGKLVRTLADGTLGDGRHSLRWNGTSDNGACAAAGIYFVTLDSPDGRASTRLVRLE